MCGLAGHFRFDGSSANDALVRTIASRLTHRGPDEQGFYCPDSRWCAMALRRLSIVDPDSSHQPMTAPDGSATIVFNGEIYNHPALRKELAAQGQSFHTRGEAEVLLALYQTLGPVMITRLEGMFALAIADHTRQSVLIARDRIGQKPLFFHHAENELLITSEAKTLKGTQYCETFHKQGVLDLLTTGYIAPYSSIYSKLKKLPSACLALVDRHGLNVEQYWKPRFISLPSSQDQRDEIVLDRLKYSVNTHLLSDVPLGVLLSGGIDSAVVTALATCQVDDPAEIRTFTAGFNDPAYDERDLARKVAAQLGTTHTELLIEPDPADLPELILDQYDEPFADSSALPTFLLSQALREHVKTALVGDGGDEVFLGYDRYRAMLISENLHPAQYIFCRLISAALDPITPQAERNRLRRFIRFSAGLAHPPAVRYFAYRRLFSPADLIRMLTPAFREALDTEQPAREFCELYEASQAPDEPTRCQFHDILHYLPGDLLVKSDTASMAASLELRAPMLDHDLVSIGLSLPTSDKLNRREGKRTLRRLFADRLPTELFQAPKKGFAVPLGRWLREDLRQIVLDTFTDSALARLGVFQEDALAELVNDHLAGRADHSHRLWALIILSRWLVRENA